MSLCWHTALLQLPLTRPYQISVLPSGGECRVYFWRLCVELPLSWIVLNFGAGKASDGDIDLSSPYFVCFSRKLSGGTPLQNFVFLLNSECSYEFLVLGSLSPKGGYPFLIFPTNQGAIFRQAPRIDTPFSGALMTVGVSW